MLLSVILINNTRTCQECPVAKPVRMKGIKLSVFDKIIEFSKISLSKHALLESIPIQAKPLLDYI